MKSAEENDRDKVEKKVELKYCERCGALGVREIGGGEVYCDRCLLQVAELPPAKKKPGKVMLPVQRHSIIEDYEVQEDDEEIGDIENEGGAA